MMAPAPDVVVVGAGVAGLAAATALSAAGARVLVVEARGSLGGRASSFHDRAAGRLIDNGQHVVLGCYRDTFAFLDRLGARDGIDLQRALEVPVVDRDGRPSVLRCPHWPSPWHLIGGILGWSGLTWRDRLNALRLGPELRRARALAQGRRTVDAGWEAQTVAEWLRRHGQTPRLCELLWEPLAVAALNQHIDTAAAASFIRVLGGVFGPDPRDAAIGVPAAPLSEVFGTPARRYLESRGSTVRLHAPARLIVDQGRVAGVEVRGDRIAAATVVSAVPWTAWRTLIDEGVARAAGLTAVREAALQRRSSSIVTVNIWVDRPVLASPFLGLPGRAFQWVFEHRWPRAGHPPADVHLSCVSSGADAITRAGDDALIDMAWTGLQRAIAAAANAAIVRASVVRERHATFSLAPGEPARPGTATPVANLWLAGDWTDTGLPATIESAAVSGHAAARAVLGRGNRGPP